MDIKDFAVKYDLDNLNMGYIPGSENILFIKTGQGGSIYGYENKYLHLAWAIREKYGFSVLVSSTTDDASKEYDIDMLVLNKIFVNQSYQIYYLGVSKGGLVGIWRGGENSNIKRMVAINPPLMINYHSKTRPALDKLGSKLTIVIGSLDPSYDYVPFAKGHTHIEVLMGADHNLVGSPKSLLEIVEKYLINNDE